MSFTLFVAAMNINCIKALAVSLTSKNISMYTAHVQMSWELNEMRYVNELTLITNFFNNKSYRVSLIRNKSNVILS